MSVNKEVQQKIEQRFKEACLEQRIKFASNKYYQTQFTFFMGAIFTFEALGRYEDAPPYWSIYLASRREILESYTLPKL